MPTTAIYAGSFDPVTRGHLDIIQRGTGLFDRLVVAVGDNPAKRYRFTWEQRVSMVERAVEAIPAVDVVRFQGLLVHAAQTHGAMAILRGVRSASDFDSEFRYGLANRALTGIETVLLPADREHVFVSSSLIKEIHSNGGDVAPYVPGHVLEALNAGESQ